MTTMRAQKFYDFNIHTTPECESTPEAMAETASGYGYAGIAITNRTPHPPRASKTADYAGTRIYSGIGDGGLPRQATLFSESHGRVILATPEPDTIIERLRDVPHRIIGTVGGEELVIGIDGEAAVTLPLRKIKNAGEEITRMMR